MINSFNTSSIMYRCEYSELSMQIDEVRFLAETQHCSKQKKGSTRTGRRRK